MSDSDKRSDSGLYDEIDIEPFEDDLVKPNRAESADTNAMLAEVSYMEGEELLARGDRANAITQFRNAVNYSANNVAYIVKLADLLAETQNGRVEAAKLLEQAINLSPNDANLRIKLKELRDNNTRRDLTASTPKKGTARIRENVTSNLNPTKNLDEVELINKEIKDLEKSSPEQVRDAKRRTEPLVFDLSSKPRETRAPGKLLIQSSDAPLPNKISSIKWLILSIMAMIMVGGLAYRLLPAAELKLLEPAINTVVDAKDINFKWSCKRTDIFYVVEVYEQGDMVMKQIVKGDSYIPDDVQKAVFKTDQTYTWLVKTMPNNEQGYDLQSEMKSFKIGKEAALPEPPPITPKQPEPVQQPTKPEPDKFYRDNLSPQDTSELKG